MVLMTKLDPAYSVIRKFDQDKRRGESVLADRLGKDRSTILKWTLPREKGGTGGYVPPWHYEEIIAFAQELGVALEPSEFVIRARGGCNQESATV